MGKIYEVPVHHMLALMGLVLLLNIVCVGLAFMVAREKQYKSTTKSSACGAITGMGAAFAGRPKSFYLLLAINCMVWMGNTVWGTYGKDWFTGNVFEGDNDAPVNSTAYKAYTAGNRAFSTAGQWGQILSLVLSLSFMGFGLIEKCPDHLLFSPSILSGAVVCFLCAFVVGNSGNFAIAMFVMSNIMLTASASFPYGFVAVWNKAAEEAGEVGSVAMQMAILNCCITVGQQACTMLLEGLQHSYGHTSALQYLFAICAFGCGGAGVAALFLNVSGTGKSAVEESSDSDYDSS